MSPLSSQTQDDDMMMLKYLKASSSYLYSEVIHWLMEAMEISGSLSNHIQDQTMLGSSYRPF
jgi:hypothetical protein